MSNSINQNVAPTTLEKCEIIQKGSNIIKQQHMENYNWHKKTTINQNVAPTTLNVKNEDIKTKTKPIKLIN